MKIYLIAILLLSVTACVNNRKYPIKFSQEEIESLVLDSTQKIAVNNNNSLTVDLTPFLKKKEYNFGKMIKEIKVLPLESIHESLLSEIEHIVVTDSNIYIHDSYKRGSLAIFDKEGNFIKRIIVGEAPNELLYNLKYIAFDADNNELIVLHNHFFSFFTPDGEFKRRDKIPLNSYSFAITPNGYLFHSAKGLNNKHINSDVEYLILMTDKRYKLLSVGFPCTYAQNNNFEGLTRYLDISKDRINFTFKFTNGVYQYVDDYNVNLKYTLNLGSKGIPDRLFQENYSTLMDGLRSNDYYFYMGTCVENEAHSFFRLLNLFTKQYSFIYRDKKTGNCEGGTSWILDKSLHPQLNPPISSYGKYFVSYFLPTDAQLLTSKVLPEEMVTKIKSLNEDDNPVLVFYELKDF